MLKEFQVILYNEVNTYKNPLVKFDTVCNMAVFYVLYQAECERDEAHLVYIDDEYENNFIKDLVQCEFQTAFYFLDLCFVTDYST